MAAATAYHSYVTSMETMPLELRDRDIARACDLLADGRMHGIYSGEESGIVAYVENDEAGERFATRAAEAPALRARMNLAFDAADAAAKRLAKLESAIRETLKLSEPSDARELLQDHCEWLHDELSRIMSRLETTPEV